MTLYDSRSITTRASRRLARMAEMLAGSLHPNVTLDLICELDALTRDLTALDVSSAGPVDMSAASIAAGASQRARSLHALCHAWPKHVPDRDAVECMHRHAGALVLAAVRLSAVVEVTRGDV